MFAKDLEHIGEKRHAGAKEQEAYAIQRRGVVLTKIRHVPPLEPESGERDRKIDEEYHAPMQPVDNDSAEKRPHERPDQRGDRDEIHRHEHLRARERPHQRRSTHGRHHGASHPLGDSSDDQQRDIRGEAAGQRTEHEQQHRQREHALGPETIRHPSADWDENRQTQCVTREHRLQT